MSSVIPSDNGLNGMKAFLLRFPYTQPSLGHVKIEGLKDRCPHHPWKGGIPSADIGSNHPPLFIGSRSQGDPNPLPCYEMSRFCAVSSRINAFSACLHLFI